MTAVRWRKTCERLDHELVPGTRTRCRTCELEVYRAWRTGQEPDRGVRRYVRPRGAVVG